MPTTVQIAVTLDSSGVVTGVKNVNSTLDSIPAHAKPAFEKVTTSQRGAAQAVNELAYGFGVQIPAEIAKAISKVPALAAALEGLGEVAGIAVAVGAVAKLVNNLDDAYNTALKYGLFWQQFWQNITTGGHGALQEFDEIAREQSFIKPFQDQILQFQQAATAAGKQGANAIIAQFDARKQDLQKLLQQQLGAAQQAFGGPLLSGSDPRYQQTSALLQTQYTQSVLAAEKTRDAELLTVRKQLAEQTIDLQSQADQAGASQFAQIIAQEQAEIQKLNYTLKLQGASPGTVNADDEAVRKKNDALLNQMSRDWENGTRQLENQIARQGLSGVAAVNAQVASEVDQQRQAFEKAWGNFSPIPDPNTPQEKYQQQQYLIAAQELQDRITAINRAGDQQRAEFEQQTTDEIIAEQAKAANASLPPWQRANAQAVSDYQARVRQIHEEQQKEGLSDKQAADLMTAAWAQANAAIVENMRQTRDELASQLESVFDDITSGNIGQAILGQIKHFFAEIVAQWILSMTQMKSATQGNSLGIGSIIGSQGGGGLLGSILGGFLGIGNGGSSTANMGASSSLLSSIAPALAIGGAVATPLALGAFTGTSDISGLSNPFGMPAGTGLVNGLANPFGAAATLSAGTGTAALAAQQQAQSRLSNTVGGSIIEGVASKYLTHGISLGKFSLSGTQTGLLGGSIALESLLGAYSSANSTLGVAGGAAGGALAGFSYGGPVGAVVGGIAGGIAGLFSAILGGRHKENEAIDAVNNTYTPAISQIVQQYKQFQTQYQDAITGLSDLENQAHQQLHQIGGPADDIYKQALVPEVSQAETTIKTIEAERDRRAAITFAPPQFAGGGTIPGFGPVPIVGHGQEEVIRMPYAAQNRDLLQYINAGGTVGGSSTVIHNHFNITALDSKSFDEYVKNPKNARSLRNAVRLDQLRYAGGNGLV